MDPWDWGGCGAVRRVGTRGTVISEPAFGNLEPTPSFRQKAAHRAARCARERKCP